ncbi:hypothetical protein ACH5RR_006652 [Cinchona calisaya]|uniref:DUF4283 domain-containing protein n=1 Tax=Cinchona calisaya TaxID=153742 RepID=A0ABD3APL8_9GENT
MEKTYPTCHTLPSSPSLPPLAPPFTESFKDALSIPSFIMGSENSQNILLMDDNQDPSLIVKPFGRSLGFKFFDLKMRELWRPNGNLDMADLGKDFFMTRFHDLNDYFKVLAWGPGFINIVFLTIRLCEPSFNLESVSHNLAMVWIRLPNLPIEYYDHHILLKMGSQLGKLVKIDTKTVSGRGRFARLCIQIDLDKPVMHSIKAGDLIQAIQYEEFFDERRSRFFCDDRGSQIGALDASAIQDEDPLKALNSDNLHIYINQKLSLSMKILNPKVNNGLLPPLLAILEKSLSLEEGELHEGNQSPRKRYKGTQERYESDDDNQPLSNGSHRLKPRTRRHRIHVENSESRSSKPKDGSMKRFGVNHLPNSRGVEGKIAYFGPRETKEQILRLPSRVHPKNSKKLGNS